MTNKEFRSTSNKQLKIKTNNQQSNKPFNTGQLLIEAAKERLNLH